MSACPSLSAAAGNGVADALRSVDCMSARATGTAFARLFGSDEGLGTVLTLALTIYVALLAVSLLSGRSKLGLSMLAPRALAIGLALTFATSWVAYQSVVWNLAVGAPDEIASVIVGTRGSATLAFADRLDGLFSAVADAAKNAQAGDADTTPKAAGFGPADVLWLGALLLLLGTVGVLIVTKIALAALLALGPVFVVLSLFRGTRGLFEGWLKGVTLFAVTPLFAVLIGGGALVALTPIVASLAGGAVEMRSAVTVLLGAVVYCALMGIVMKVAVTLTSGWRPFGSREPGSGPDRSALWASAPALPAIPGQQAGAPVPLAHDRVRAIVSGIGMAPAQLEAPGASHGGSDRVRTITSTPALSAPATPAFAADSRARGIGSQFRQPVVAAREIR